MGPGPELLAPLRRPHRPPHDGTDVEALADTIRAKGRTVVLLPGDLADPAVAPQIVADAAQAPGPLQALVLSHCESVDHTFLGTTVTALQQHLAVNAVASAGGAVWRVVGSAGGRAVGPAGGRVVG